MSNVFDAIAWAIKVSKGEPMPARMLLIVGLAQRVGNQSDGFLVWPSITQICADTDMSRTSVKKWMRHLQELGFVQVLETVRDNGSKGTNRYRLAVRAVFYHPTKGAMVDEGDGSPSDRGVGRHPTEGGSVDPTGGGSPARPCIEPPLEQPFEDSTGSEDSELPLGLPPIPIAEPTPSDVAAFVAEEWAKRSFATPIRGGTLSDANAEKARDLGKSFAVGAQNALGTWSDIFEAIDASDFLQGKARTSGERAPFKLSLSFVLEKRNFDKILTGRFNGKSSGAARPGSASQATSRVIERIRAGRGTSAGGGNPRLTDGR